jgi:hypothetical protein
VNAANPNIDPGASTDILSHATACAHNFNYHSTIPHIENPNPNYFPSSNHLPLVSPAKTPSLPLVLPAVQV